MTALEQNQQEYTASGVGGSTGCILKMAQQKNMMELTGLQLYP